MPTHTPFLSWPYAIAAEIALQACNSACPSACRDTLVGPTDLLPAGTAATRQPLPPQANTQLPQGINHDPPIGRRAAPTRPYARSVRKTGLAGCGDPLGHDDHQWRQRQLEHEHRDVERMRCAVERDCELGPREAGLRCRRRRTLRPAGSDLLQNVVDCDSRHQGPDPQRVGRRPTRAAGRRGGYRPPGSPFQPPGGPPGRSPGQPWWPAQGPSAVPKWRQPPTDGPSAIAERAQIRAFCIHFCDEVRRPNCQLTPRLDPPRHARHAMTRQNFLDSARTQAHQTVGLGDHREAVTIGGCRENP